MAAQVNPAPKATRSNFEPGWMRPFLDPLVQRHRDGGGAHVPVAIHVHVDRSRGIPAYFAVDSMMRMLAWCGTRRSTSSP
jgi:hypothetical protein